MHRFNRGEWSELYAFAKILCEGRVYAADENVQKIKDIYFPVLKLLRKETEDNIIEYYPGEKVKVFRNNILLEEISKTSFENDVNSFCESIFKGGDNDGAFYIPSVEGFIDSMHISKVKASSSDKADITMQIHDINTGYSPIVGFSVKSDAGSPPTLLNAGKNTRFYFEVKRCNDKIMNCFNSISKENCKDYMVERMQYLASQDIDLIYSHMDSEIYEDNLILIDSNMPAIFAELLLNSYRYSYAKVVDIETLTALTAYENKFNYRNKEVYRHKVKKLLCASALGMTPGKMWDGTDAASGGYIIVKRDGDVLCYHLYNRNFFEEYLIRNTKTDRPSASRFDFGYIYKENMDYFIALNNTIRFKSISAASKEIDVSNERITSLFNRIHKLERIK